MLLTMLVYLFLLGLVADLTIKALISERKGDVKIKARERDAE